MPEAASSHSPPPPGAAPAPEVLRHSSNQRWIPLIVLAGALLLTFVAAAYVARATRRDEEARFQRAAQNATTEVRDRILRRVNGCITLLRGLGGLFAASDDVTAVKFHNYIDRLELSRNFPSVRAVGYSRH